MTGQSAIKLATLLEKSGLHTAPDQIWKSIRLVPLITEKIYDDVHLAPEYRQEDLTFAAYDKTKTYVAYIPHGLVLQEDRVSAQAQLGSSQQKNWESFRWGYLSRMAQKKKGGGLAFLPQHLAISSYLAHHFGAPDVYWKDFYNRRCLKMGVGESHVDVFPGSYFYDLETALRQFEIYKNQVGMLLFLDDRLINAVVYPHPQDYRRLHTLLLHDYYGQELFWWSHHYRDLPLLLPDVGENVDSLAALGQALESHLSDIKDFHLYMSSELFDTEVLLQRLYRYREYELHSFMGPLEYGQTGFAGEIIFSEARLAYLNVFWLSQKQVKEAWYYRHLQQHDWDPFAAAKAMNLDIYAFVRRLSRTALASMIQGPWLEQAKKDQRMKERLS